VAHQPANEHGWERPVPENLSLSPLLNDRNDDPPLSFDVLQG
jgi:hypothetical protein